MPRGNLRGKKSITRTTYGDSMKKGEDKLGRLNFRDILLIACNGKKKGAETGVNPQNIRDLTESLRLGNPMEWRRRGKGRSWRGGKKRMVLDKHP